MLLYTHTVWAIDLMAFVGADSWINADLSQAINANRPWAFSHLWYVESPALIWGNSHCWLCVVHNADSWLENTVRRALWPGC